MACRLPSGRIRQYSLCGRPDNRAEYRIAVLPTTFVVDSAGRIRKVLVGPQSEHSLSTALASVASSPSGQHS